MAFVKQCIITLAALLLSISVNAATLDVAGVKIEETIDFQGSKLVLNGAGVRYRAVFKVYAGALYVSKKVATSDAFFAAPGPKRLIVTMLREVDADDIGKSFTKGFEDNTAKAELPKLTPGMVKMGQIFSDQKKLAAGDNFTVDWIPGSGMVISIKGKAQGEPFKEPEFYAAMMRIWLGASPGDSKLKDALLGKSL